MIASVRQPLLTKKGAPPSAAGSSSSPPGDHENPEEAASFFRRATFLWTRPLIPHPAFQTGEQKTTPDLPRLNAGDNLEELSAKWDREARRKTASWFEWLEKDNTVRFVWFLYAQLQPQVALRGVVLAFGIDLYLFAEAVLVAQVLQYGTELQHDHVGDSAGKREGTEAAFWMWLVVLILAKFGVSACGENWWFTCCRFGQNGVAIMQCKIYELLACRESQAFARRGRTKKGLEVLEEENHDRVDAKPQDKAGAIEDEKEKGAKAVGQSSGETTTTSASATATDGNNELDQGKNKKVDYDLSNLIAGDWSGDVFPMMWLPVLSTFLPSYPVFILWFCYQTYCYLGRSFLPLLTGLVFASASASVGVFLTKRYLTPRRKEVQLARDLHVKRLTFFLAGVRLVKLQCWEDRWRKLLGDARREELLKLWRAACAEACASGVSRGLEQCVFPAMIAVFVLGGHLQGAGGGSPNVLLPSNAFAAFLIVEKIKGPIVGRLRHMINVWAKTQPIIQRALQFLTDYDVEVEPDEPRQHINNDQSDGGGGRSEGEPLLFLEPIGAPDRGRGAASRVGAGPEVLVCGYKKKQPEADGENDADKESVSKEKKLDHARSPRTITEEMIPSSAGAALCSTDAFRLEVPLRVADDPHSTLEHICRGQLIVLVGRVGSGKSTLIHSLSNGSALGRSPLTDARIRLVRHAQPAYVAQKPHLLSGSIRDNIVFKKNSASNGAPHDDASEEEALYETVLQKCSLAEDMARFPDGDRTLVGSKGVQLSGGQKTRVCLARALFSRPDVLFLDDVLSAVDAKTGREIFKNCVWDPCLLAAKTAVVLATHQLHYLFEVGAGTPQGGSDFLDTLFRSGRVKVLHLVRADSDSPAAARAGTAAAGEATSLYRAERMSRADCERFLASGDRAGFPAGGDGGTTKAAGHDDRSRSATPQELEVVTLNPADGTRLAADVDDPEMRELELQRISCRADSIEAFRSSPLLKPLADPDPVLLPDDGGSTTHAPSAIALRGGGLDQSAPPRLQSDLLPDTPSHNLDVFGLKPKLKSYSTPSPPVSADYFRKSQLQDLDDAEINDDDNHEDAGALSRAKDARKPSQKGKIFARTLSREEDDAVLEKLRARAMQFHNAAREATLGELRGWQMPFRGPGGTATSTTGIRGVLGGGGGHGFGGGSDDGNFSLYAPPSSSGSLLFHPGSGYIPACLPSSGPSPWEELLSWQPSQSSSTCVADTPMLPDMNHLTTPVNLNLAPPRPRTADALRRDRALDLLLGTGDDVEMIGFDGPAQGLSSSAFPKRFDAVTQTTPKTLGLQVQIPTPSTRIDILSPSGPRGITTPGSRGGRPGSTTSRASSSTPLGLAALQSLSRTTSKDRREQVAKGTSGITGAAAAGPALPASAQSASLFLHEAVEMSEHLLRASLEEEITEQFVKEFRSRLQTSAVSSLQQERGAAELSWRLSRFYLRLIVPRMSTSLTLEEALQLAKLALLALCMVVSCSCQIGQQVVLQRWAAASSGALFTAPSESGAADSFDPATVAAIADVNESFLPILLFVVILQVVVQCVEKVLISDLALTAARKMYDRMLSKLLYAKLRFFDATPAGYIISRFQNDLTTLDEGLPETMYRQAGIVLRVGGGLLVMVGYLLSAALASESAGALVLLVAFLFFAYSVADYIRSDTKQAVIGAQRWFAQQKPLVVDWFLDVATNAAGLFTVRAFRRSPQFRKAFNEKVTNLQKSNYYEEAMRKHQQTLLVQFGSFLFAVICFFSGVGLIYFNSPDSSELGVILTQGLFVAYMIMPLMQGFTELEVEFVSVERCAELALITEVEPEPPASRVLLANKKHLAGKRKAATQPDETASALTASHGVVEMAALDARGDEKAVSGSEGGKQEHGAKGASNPLAQPLLEPAVLPQPPPSQAALMVARRSSQRPQRLQTRNLEELEEGQDNNDDEYALVCRNLFLRYALNKPPVLNDVSLCVRRGAKVCILGRTGSGKSSLFNALTGLYASRQLGGDSCSPPDHVVDILPQDGGVAADEESRDVEASGESRTADGGDKAGNGSKMNTSTNTNTGVYFRASAASGKNEVVQPTRTAPSYVQLNCHSGRRLRDIRQNSFKVVSQDSALLKGVSFRENMLGPDEHVVAEAEDHTETSDHVKLKAADTKRILDMLSRVGMDPNKVQQAFGAHLDDRALDDADDFSVGEKQLFAIARALLASPDLIFCDEATANVDLETDRKIHELILHGLDRILGKPVTVVWIMHRLEFVGKFDQVIVMDAGRIVEDTGSGASRGQEGTGYLARMLEEYEKAKKAG